MKRKLGPVCALLLVVNAWAGPSTDSPFMSDGAAGGVAPVASSGGPVEFCGLMAGESGTLFGIYEPAKQKGQWLALNQGGGEFVVRGYDAARRQVTIEGRGQVQTLAMKEPKMDGTAALGPVAAAAVPGVQAGGGVSPADEALRLQAVAEEVKRRRAMRAAAAAGGQAPQAPGARPAVPPNGQQQ